MESALKICRKYYPKVYKLYTEGNDECKSIAIDIYYHGWGSTFDKDIADFCEKIGFGIQQDENEMYFVSYSGAYGFYNSEYGFHKELNVYYNKQIKS